MQLFNKKYVKILMIALMCTCSNVWAEAIKEQNSEKTELQKQKEYTQKMFKAVREADVEALKKAVSAGADVNALNDRKEKTLQVLFQYMSMDKAKREATANYLISQGLNLDHVGGFGSNYLLEAIGYDLLSTAELLIDKGVDTTAKSTLGGETATFFASSVPMLELLLEKKVGSLKDVNNDGDTLLHNASSIKPSLDMVKYLSKHMPVDAKNKDGETPLLQVVKYDYFPDQIDSIVEYLLKAGADVNAIGKKGRTPLLAAVRNRKLKEETIERLINAGAEVSHKDEFGISAVHFSAASSLRYLKFLVEHGADINEASGTTKQTPLHVATEYNRKHTVKYLLDKGAKVNAKDIDAKTALNYAKDGDYSDIVMMLEEKKALATPAKELEDVALALRNKKDAEKKKEELKISNIYDAIFAKNLEATKLYYEDKSQKHDSLEELGMYTIQESSLEIFKYFVSQGLDIHKLNKKGYSLLHYAVFYNNVEIAEYLVENKLDINLVSTDNRSVFILSSNSSVEMVKLLMASGVKIDKEKDGNIVDEAIRYGVPDVAEFFMKKGYKVTAEKYKKNKRLMQVILDSNTKMMTFLLKLGVDIESTVDYRGYTASLLHMAVMLEKKDMVFLLLKAGANVNVKNNRKDALFKDAINNGDLEVLTDIYDNGGDLNDKTGTFTNTPLHVALDLQRVKIARFLVNRGADVNIVEGFYENTPMHVAAQKGYLDLMKLMQSKGADLKSLNKNGVSVLDMATKYKQQAVEKYLRN